MFLNVPSRAASRKAVSGLGPNAYSYLAQKEGEIENILSICISQLGHSVLVPTATRQTPGRTCSVCVSFPDFGCLVKDRYACEALIN